MKVIENPMMNMIEFVTTDRFNMALCALPLS
jgi:hypothetical protein